MNRDELEDRVRERSYAIWEREGRLEGRDLEYWDRACREIGEELLDATVQGSNPQLVLPVLRVSSRPVRRDGERNSQAA